MLLLQGCASKEVVSPDLAQNSSQSADFDNYGTSSNDFDDYSDAEHSDPLEGYNRVMHNVNDFLLLNIIKPVHQGYTYIMPKKIRSGLSNFSDNLLFPVRFINAVLQLDLGGASVEFSHFLINTMTSLGFADVASTKENYFYYNPRAYDFGVTLARWGVGEGPMIVLPIFGPKNIRDTFGFIGDIAMDPIGYVAPIQVTLANGGLAFNGLDAIYVPYEEMKKIAIDPYISIRDAVKDQRKGLVEEHLSHF